MKAAKTDKNAPEMLRVTVEDSDGNVWATNIVAGAKEFKSGAVGFYLGEKITNPQSGERYQLGASFVLIGSKPKELE